MINLLEIYNKYKDILDEAWNTLPTEDTEDETEQELNNEIWSRKDQVRQKKIDIVNILSACTTKRSLPAPKTTWGASDSENSFERFKSKKFEDNKYTVCKFLGKKWRRTTTFQYILYYLTTVDVQMMKYLNPKYYDDFEIILNGKQPADKKNSNYHVAITIELESAEQIEKLTDESQLTKIEKFHEYLLTIFPDAKKYCNKERDWIFFQMNESWSAMSTKDTEEDIEQNINDNFIFEKIIDLIFKIRNLPESRYKYCFFEENNVCLNIDFWGSLENENKTYSDSDKKKINKFYEYLKEKNLDDFPVFKNNYIGGLSYAKDNINYKFRQPNSLILCSIKPSYSKSSCELFNQEDLSKNLKKMEQKILLNLLNELYKYIKEHSK